MDTGCCHGPLTCSMDPDFLPGRISTQPSFVAIRISVARTQRVIYSGPTLLLKIFKLFKSVDNFTTFLSFLFFFSQCSFQRTISHKICTDFEILLWPRQSILPLRSSRKKKGGDLSLISLMLSQLCHSGSNTQSFCLLHDGLRFLKAATMAPASSSPG